MREYDWKPVDGKETAHEVESWMICQAAAEMCRFCKWGLVPNCFENCAARKRVRNRLEGVLG